MGVGWFNYLKRFSKLPSNCLNIFQRSTQPTKLPLKANNYRIQLSCFSNQNHNGEIKTNLLNKNDNPEDGFRKSEVDRRLEKVSQNVSK